jgi:hypothetical protein
LWFYFKPAVDREPEKKLSNSWYRGKIPPNTTLRAKKAQVKKAPCKPAQTRLMKFSDFAPGLVFFSVSLTLFSPSLSESSHFPFCIAF